MPKGKKNVAPPTKKPRVSNAKEKHPGGRPTKYEPKYCTEIIKYFSNPQNTPLPLFEDYAHTLGIAKSTLYKWGEDQPEFSDALKKAKEIQEARWIKAALENKINVSFAIFMGKNCFHWKDKQEHDLSGELTIKLTKFSETDFDETDG